MFDDDEFFDEEDTVSFDDLKGRMEPTKKQGKKKASRPERDESANDFDSDVLTIIGDDELADQEEDVPLQDLKGMTVAVLKTLCRDKGLKVTGRKQELIDRLHGALT